jgi:putative transposase
MILELIDEAVAAGAREHAACALFGLSPRALQRWRAVDIGDDRRYGPKTNPKNRLTDREHQQVLATLNAPAFRDLSPKQIVPRLADQGRYIASESTMYRILRSEGQLAHRGRAKPPVTRTVEEHVATAPNQVWMGHHLPPDHDQGSVLLLVPDDGHLQPPHHGLGCARGGDVGARVDAHAHDVRRQRP